MPPIEQVRHYLVQAIAPPMLTCPIALMHAFQSHNMTYTFYNRTVTSTQGIRMPPRFSTALRSHSKPFVVALAVSVILPLLAFLRAPSIAALANDPPVPFSADTAKPAVSQIISCTVALPLTKFERVSETGTAGCHRGSNQSALKSRSEKQRIVRSIEQYTHGFWSAHVPAR